MSNIISSPISTFTRQASDFSLSISFPTFAHATNSLVYFAHASDIHHDIMQSFPSLSGHPASLDTIAQLIQDAFESADLDMDIEAAVKWGFGFRFPASCHSSDLEELNSLSGDLEGLILCRQA